MAKPTLVTGANGHLGNNLCRLLVERGEPVRAMLRRSADPAPLQGLDIEIVYGDILNTADAARAVENCGRVYHVAAGFLLWARDPERDIIKPSVEGTRNVLEAAAGAGVEKVVYTSTTGTVGFSSTPTPLDETHHNADPHTHYVRGKIAAEQEAFAIARRTGLPVVAIQPGLIAGPRFWKLSESVRQMADFLNLGGMPVYFDGGFGVVDVDDVARGATLAMEKGRPGERYILSGEDVTLKQAFELMAELTGLMAPAIKVPIPVVRAVAAVMEFACKPIGMRPMLDRSQVDDFAGKYAYFSSAKAQRELGYTYMPARETLQRTVTWLLEHGFVTERRRQRILGSR